MKLRGAELMTFLVPGAVLLASSAGVAHATKDPAIPDWVTQAASSAPLPGEWRDAKAVYLLEESVLSFEADGRAVERYRAVVKILRPGGRDFAHPVAGFSNEEKLESFHVWSIGPDGHHYAMKDSDYVEVGADDPGMLYIDERAKLASPPGADPGGIVAWEATTQLPSYLSEDIWSFQHSIPVARAAYEIDLPAGWHQYSVWFKHDRMQPAEVTTNHFRWEQTNIDGIDLSDIPLAPEWEALAGRMSVHFSAHDIPQGDALWAKIGDWYYGLAAQRSEGGPDVATEARLLAREGDFMARLAKIADFMQQQIRYVGIEIGIGNLQPHAAAEVFQKRYGDCKDKATLMISMLDAVGIRATWVSVDHRRGVVDPGAPSIYGDHVITAIEIPKGYENPRLEAVVTARTGRRYLFFDPTNPYVPVGQLPDYLQGGYGLLVAGEDSQVIQLPVLKPEKDTIDRRANFALSADGTLTGEVTVLRDGAQSDRWRGRLAMGTDKDQRQMLEHLLQQDFSSFTLGSEKVAHVRELDQPLEMDYQVTAPLYAKSAGSLLLVRPRVLGSDAEGLDNKPRKVPISFEGVGTWRDNFDLKIPAGYTVDDVPDPVSLDVGFATYHSEVKAVGDTLHYQREYVLKKLALEPGEYSVLQKLEATIARDENNSAVLKKQ